MNYAEAATQYERLREQVCENQSELSQKMRELQAMSIQVDAIERTLNDRMRNLRALAAKMHKLLDADVSGVTGKLPPGLPESEAGALPSADG
jgi:hypothetical protein